MRRNCTTLKEKKEARSKNRLEPQSAETSTRVADRRWKAGETTSNGDTRILVVKEMPENVKLVLGLSCAPYSGQINGLFRNFPLWVLLVSLPLNRARAPITRHHFWFLLPGNATGPLTFALLAAILCLSPLRRPYFRIPITPTEMGSDAAPRFISRSSFAPHASSDSDGGGNVPSRWRHGSHLGDADLERQRGNIIKKTASSEGLHFPAHGGNF